MMSSNTRLSDVVLEDSKLSMAAKGVFVSIGFLGNGCTLEQLKNTSTNNQDSIQQAVNELEHAGYVEIDSGNVHIKNPSAFGAKDP